MKHILLIAGRIYKQLLGDKRFLIFSILVPLVVIYFLKVAFDSLGTNFPSQRYVLPIIGFVVLLLSLILCAVLLVQERNNGTLERMFVSGFKRVEIISGYTLGYLGLATLQSAIALTEGLFLFNLNYSWDIILSLFLVYWTLSVVSVMLGIFISTFARNEAQVLPFIPMVFLPSIFFSGFFVDIDKLPKWANYLGHLLPVFYSNTIILELIKPNGHLINKIWYLIVLILIGVVLLVLASRTLKERE